MLKGRTYQIIAGILGVLAAIGSAFILAFTVMPDRRLTSEVSYWIATAAALLCVLFLQPNVLVHELGHILFGLTAGLHPVSFCAGHLAISRKGVSYSFKRDATGGMSAFLPKKNTRLRQRYSFVATGGIVFNFLYGALFLTLWWLFPSPAFYFFALFAPLSLYEGIAAILPAEADGERTDGAFLGEIRKNSPFAQTFLAVCSAQGALRFGSLVSVKRREMFALPVVREDEPAFVLLTQLRWQYYFLKGEEKSAVFELNRLEEIREYLPVAKASTACDLVYGYAVLQEDKERAATFLEETKGAEEYEIARAEAALGLRDKETALLCSERAYRGIKELEEKLVARILDSDDE